jgi:hypothetical protein
MTGTGAVFAVLMSACIIAQLQGTRTQLDESRRCVSFAVTIA